ncbi:tetratricopeptide repeat protein [Roseibium sp. HPY-6]|uniref:tetratricopeptide repeat protein n=1 Tax=Roseibium sp. HPY-6 TaxID=3229852 RepID=UPI00338FC961
MPTKAARPCLTKMSVFALATAFFSTLSDPRAAAQETDLDAVSVEQAKVEQPAVIDVTTRDKTLFSIIDAGPPKIDELKSPSSELAYAAFQRGWFLTALGLATPLAEQGDKAAQALLGVLHEKGLGIELDKSKAADWYSLAAAAGDSGSALQLAQFYLLGTGVDVDKTKAADLFEQAADAGNASALYNLAILYQEGEGRPFDEEKARQLLEEAARKNDPEAQYALGLSFLESQTGLNDPGQGAFWLGRAARRGHTSAQVYYGILRHQGKGVDPNEAEAADWFERAAIAGNPVAMNRLARIYAYGRGREQDFTAAAGWHLAARSNGVPDFNLDRIVETLDEKTIEGARVLAEQHTTTLLAPTEDPAAESP